MISPTRESVGKDGKKHKYPSKARQCKLLGIARSTCYYNRKDGESQTNLKMMELMDKLKRSSCELAHMKTGLYLCEGC